MLISRRAGFAVICSTGLFFAGAACAAAPKIPTQMQAVFADPTGGPGALKIDTVDVPTPKEGQVLVEVYAAGANPVDWGMRRARQGGGGGGGGDAGPGPGGPRPGGPPPAGAGAPNGGPPGGGGGQGAGGPPQGPPRQNPGILGREISGVVVALGSGVTQYKVGDKVIVALRQTGGYAQYAVANVDDMAMKPRKLTFEQAAGIPVVGFTAMRMVVVAEGWMKKNRRVVVIGAAGGVGSAAVQLAKTTGAHIITVAASQHAPFLKSIGADEIISYDKENVAEKLKNVDVVLNTVSSENGNAIGYLRRGGILLTPIGTPNAAACDAAGITCMSIVRQGPTNGELLRMITELADQGKFTVKVEKAFPMAQTGEAFDFGLSGNREGKVVIDVRPDAKKL